MCALCRGGGVGVGVTATKSGQACGISWDLLSRLAVTITITRH